MEVTFAYFGEDIASSRLRARIPQQMLSKMGVKQGKDVLVYSKSWLSDDDIAPFNKRIYDVCDDHFNTPDLQDYYRKHTEEADLVTCNSEYMRLVIRDETGRDAIVVPEPYESEELPPGIGPKLLWFGHQSNVKDLHRIAKELKHPLLALSNHPLCAPWSIEAQRQALASDCIVIIPTGKSLAKSENRMVEAIRHGKYVCAEYMPSYQKFEEFFPLGDIQSHIDQALSNTEKAISRIAAAQSFIRDKYSPQTIAEKWLEVFQCL